MIKLIENFEIYDFSPLENDVFFGRIYADYCSDSMFNDSLFYVSVNDNVVNAVIGKVGSVITLSATDSAHFNELKEFFSVIGYSVILCEEKFSAYFDGYKSSGDVLKYADAPADGCKVETLYSENLKDVYFLLDKIFDLKADFMNWFADMSHKLRHNTAHCCGVYENGCLVSVAFSVFETEKSAVISSVATDENFRGRGYGENVVKALLSINITKDVYVFTENKDINNWYKKIGFIEHKNWSEIENVL